jgi:hypothetical protein
LDISKAFDTVN